MIATNVSIFQNIFIGCSVRDVRRYHILLTLLELLVPVGLLKKQLVQMEERYGSWLVKKKSNQGKHFPQIGPRSALISSQVI